MTVVIPNRRFCAFLFVKLAFSLLIPNICLTVFSYRLLVNKDCQNSWKLLGIKTRTALLLLMDNGGR